MIPSPVFFIEETSIAWEHTGEGVKRQIMAYDANLMLVKVAFETGAIGSLHSHPHVQLSYVASGKFEASIRGEKKVLSAGDVFHVPSGLEHGVVCLEAGMLIDVFNPYREDFVQ
ncbi:MAG: cupin domain-containing protein [Candidatus Pseudobacter hemicellulosilyticus]|uniref:Cupin domain-containing protein n=1 Tax=Candidatus Pseudobacter hemicellulosilyticus TaxID=3121375 RepID=A0AAJ5WYG0_9BACT|nr:MAG: cupin domain-containing protein [Pseudobacter sp.]